MGNVRILAHGLAIVSAAAIGLGLLQVKNAQAVPVTSASMTATLAGDDELCEDFCRLRDWICGTSADDGVVQLAEGFSGPVTRAVWPELSALIDDSRDLILDILDPNIEPSLSPTNSGAGAEPVDTTGMTTADIADKDCVIATAAKNEVCNATDPDHDFLGEALRQTLWLLEDLYDQANPG